MGRHHRLAAAALIAAAVLAACDGDPPKTTATSTSQPGTSANPSAQAPPVKQPLDATPFLADPCRGLTEVQRQTLALPDGTGDPSARLCRFTTAKFELLVDLVFFPSNPGGLDRLYLQHSQGQWKHWEPTEIDGYPAVLHQDSPSGTRTDCYVAVGISDSAFFKVRYALADADVKGKSPCAEGQAVASAVLSTIKAGG